MKIATTQDIKSVKKEIDIIPSYSIGDIWVVTKRKLKEKGFTHYKKCGVGKLIEV